MYHWMYFPHAINSDWSKGLLNDFRHMATFWEIITKKKCVSSSVSQVTKLSVMCYTFNLAISVLNKIPLSGI